MRGYRRPCAGIVSFPFHPIGSQPIRPPLLSSLPPLLQFGLWGAFEAYPPSADAISLVSALMHVSFFLLLASSLSFYAGGLTAQYMSIPMSLARRMARAAELRAIAGTVAACFLLRSAAICLISITTAATDDGFDGLVDRTSPWEVAFTAFFFVGLEIVPLAALLWHHRRVAVVARPKGSGATPTAMLKQRLSLNAAQAKMAASQAAAAQRGGGWFGGASSSSASSEAAFSAAEEDTALGGGSPARGRGFPGYGATANSPSADYFSGAAAGSPLRGGAVHSSQARGRVGSIAGFFGGSPSRGSRSAGLSPGEDGPAGGPDRRARRWRPYRTGVVRVIARMFSAYGGLDGELGTGLVGSPLGRGRGGSDAVFGGPVDTRPLSTGEAASLAPLRSERLNALIDASNTQQSYLSALSKEASVIVEASEGEESETALSRQASRTSLHAKQVQRGRESSQAPPTIPVASDESDAAAPGNIRTRLSTAANPREVSAAGEGAAGAIASISRGNMDAVDLAGLADVFSGAVAAPLSELHGPLSSTPFQPGPLTAIVAGSVEPGSSGGVATPLAGFAFAADSDG